MTFSWADHDPPTKHVDLKGQMTVTCPCGWKSDRSKGWAMDQYRAHVSALMPKHDEPPKQTTLDKKVSSHHSTKRRWK